MKVLALDVSTTTTGFAVIDANKKLIKYGQFTIKDRTLSDTMYAIAITKKVMAIAEKYKLSEAIIEDVFYSANISYLKTWCRVHGAVGATWYKKYKKEPSFLMASEARHKVGINGKAKKIEVQLEIGKRYNLINKDCHAKYAKAFLKLIDNKLAEHKRIATEVKSKTAQKKEKKLINSRFNYRAQKLSKQFEKETSISEHISDAIVLGLAYLK